MKQPTISERALATQKPPAPPSTQLAIHDDTVTIGGLSFRTVKQAVVPVLSQKGDDAVVFTVLEKTVLGPVIPKMDNRAWTVRVRSLQNGRIYDYVCPTIMLSAFCREYDAGVMSEGPKGQEYTPRDEGGHTYVGKSFVVQKGMKPDGKRYRQLEVVEIDASEIIDTPQDLS